MLIIKFDLVLVEHLFGKVKVDEVKESDLIRRWWLPQED